MNRERFAELDALRAFAVTLVVWSHAVGGEVGVGALRVGGYHGVTLFFVISGFLITGILLDARAAAARAGTSAGFALRAFYARRFLRIFPVYYAVLLVTFALGFDAVREELGWHLAYLSNWHFAARGEFGISTSHLWSLAVEEQFYL
ncbi:MAG: acyltransferase family protein, partial [Candidatus Binatia bacterium]